MSVHVYIHTLMLVEHSLVYASTRYTHFIQIFEYPMQRVLKNESKFLKKLLRFAVALVAFVVSVYLEQFNRSKVKKLCAE